jgi:hypothetical protein
MIDDHDTDFRIGYDGLMGIQYVLNDTQIDYISKQAVEQITGIMGVATITEIETVLIRQIFEETRSNFKSVHSDSSVLTQVTERVINVIANDAVSYLTGELSTTDHSIWNIVGKYTADSLKAIDNNRPTGRSKFTEQLRF